MQFAMEIQEERLDYSDISRTSCPPIQFPVIHYPSLQVNGNPLSHLKQLHLKGVDQHHLSIEQGYFGIR